MTSAEPKKSRLSIRDPVFCRSIRNYFREYCQCSSIHGFRYFGEKRTYFERIWWFIVFSIVVIGCVYSINLVYKKWNDSPVIVSFDTRETKINTIPFPAVTICPETKSMASKYNYTDVMLKMIQLENGKDDVNITEEEAQYAEYMSMNCDINCKLPNESELLPNAFLDFLDNVRPKTTFLSCTWMKQIIKNCAGFFVPIITDEGICYTFNMLDRTLIFSDNVIQYKNFMTNPTKMNSSWTLESGYYKDDVGDTYPRKANLAGVKNAFEVTLVTYKEDINPVCKNGIHGFKVVLHTPIRIPLVGDQYFRVPLDEAVLGALQPVKITTSDAVNIYTTSQRECYFKQERELKFFKIYSQLNCNLECLTNFTLQACGCVSFYMPRTKGTSICGAKKLTCMKWAEQYSNQNKLDKDLDNCTTIKVPPKCNCLPICSDLSYHVETTQAKWDWSEKYKVLHPNHVNKDKMSLSKLTLYFKTSQFVTSKRHELYGPTDFLANFGGLLGLFTGFSVLSIMEVVYFVTIRLFCNVRLYGRWYGPETEH